MMLRAGFNNSLLKVLGILFLCAVGLPGFGQTAPVFTSASSDASLYNSVYSFLVTTTDTEFHARTLNISAGALPTGVTFTDNTDGTATIAGTLGQTGVFNFDITVLETVAPFQSTVQNFTLTINKADPVITWANPAAITYGTTLSATQLNAVADVPGTFTYTPASGTLLNAGANQVLSADFVPIDNTNYNDVLGTTVLLTVSEAALSITATNQSKTYGNAFTFTGTEFTSTGLQNSETIGSVTLTSTGSPATASVGGSPYTITASNATGGTFNPTNYTITYNTGSMSVGAAALSITASNQSKTYGNAFTFTGTEFTSTGLQNSETIGNVTLTSTGSPTTASVGGSPYTITASNATGGTFNPTNYTITYNTGSMSVGAAALSITASNQSKTYGNAFTFTGTEFTSTGLQNSETIGSVTLTSTGSPATASVGGSPYTITASNATGGTFNPANYTITYNTGSMSVGAAALSITASNQSKTYGNAFTFTGTEFTSTGLQNIETIGSVTLTSTGSPATASVGGSPYTITASNATGGTFNAANYSIVYNPGVLSINKAVITATADNQSRLYGASNPPLTIAYTGFQNGETSAVINVLPTASTVANAVSPVGSYAIVPSGGSDDNYTFNYTNGTLNVTKATVSVTANNQIRTYGAANPPLTISYSGFQNGETSTVIDVLPTASTIANNTSPVGSYVITPAGGSDNNYIFNYNDGTLTVNKATITVTANNQSRLYGAANPTLTITYSGFQNSENTAVIDVLPTATTPATVLSPVGGYLISAAGGADNNYTFNYVDGILTINKATLTAKADDKSRIFGQPNPAFTITYTGFLNGDNASGLDTPPNPQTVAIPSSNVGTYPITLSGGTDNNYTYAYQSGILTINKATATVAVNNNTYTYDGSPKVATASTTPSGLNVTFTYDGIGTAPTNADTYDVVGTINEINYLGSGNGTLTINKALALVTIENLYQNFTGSPKPVTTSTSPSGLNLTVTYNGSATVPSSVGSYNVDAVINEGNYTGSASAVLVINGAPTSNGIANVNVNEDASDFNINLYAAFDDVEDTDPNLNFSIIQNTNSSLFASTVINSGILSLDFAENQFGSSNITIRATDTGGLFVDQAFAVNVASVQDDPQFVSTPVTGAVQGQLYTYNVITSDPDPADTWTISNLIALPVWLSLTDNGNGTALLSGTPTNGDIGTVGIALGVVDDKGNDDTQFFNIVVSNSNDTPFFVSTPTTDATQDISYTYFINVNDDDNGDILTVTAPVLPSWLTLVDNGNKTATLSGTPDNTNIGANAVQLRVTDNSGAFSNQNFTINVDNANDAPSFTSSPVLSVNEDSFYQYNITATDPDVGDVLTLKALSKPSWLTLTDNGNGTGTLTGTPLNANVGTFSIVLNVEDQAGANVNQNFSITVNNTNDAPVFSSTPVTAALQDNQYQYNVTTTDVDAGDSRTITPIVLPSWLTLTPQGGGTALLSGTPTNANLGSNPVTLRVTDLAGAISNQSFTINVDNANDPPSFSSSPVTAGTEDQPYSYSITTTDPDAGDTRVITALSIPGWLTLTDNLNGTGTLSGTPTNSHVGNFSIVLNVRDALGANANQNFTLTISNVNDDPLFISTPVTSGVQGVQYNYSIVADDPDAGDQVTLTAPILPSWLTFTNSGNGSGSLSGTPSNGNLGANPVRLVASDMNGGSVMQEFTITVNNTNDPPTFTSTPVTAGIEDNLYTYGITATDPDVGDVLEIKSLVIPSWLTLVDHEDGTATLSGTPLNAHVGLSNVVLQVEDAQGLSVNQNFTINVSNTNDPPVFVSTPVTGAIQDQAYTYSITTSDPDQGDSRTITSLTLPSWLTLVDNNNGTASLSGTPTNANLGSNPVTIRVTDFAGAATNQSFTINVDNANDAPFFTSVAITSATEDQVYSYSITTGDPDVLDTREITSLSKPDWLTLDDNGDGTGLLSGIPTNDHVGNFTIVLNVKDALGANVNQNFTLTVANTNDPPFFTSSAIPVAVQNITYSYSVTTSDPDQGDTRTLTAPVLPAWLSFTPSGNGNGSLTGTPTNGDLGAHQVKLNIEDASGTSVEQVFTINVDNANDPPSFTSTPVTAVNEDDLYSYSISTTDPDVGDVKFITALSKPAWLTLVDNGDGTAVLSGTPLNADVGVSNVVLNVEDGIGANVNQNFSITVTNTNDAPAFTSVPVTGSIQDVQYSYSIFASDPDVGDVIVITATTKPAWLTLTDNGNGMATLQGTPTNANLGANGVTLRVTDVSGASVTQVFTINVDNQNDPPSFTSTPITSVDEGDLYVYNITTTDPDVGDTRTIEALSIPGWLTLTDNGGGTAILEGVPQNEDVGLISIVLNVSDALGANVNQNFNITVVNTNDAPGFTTSPITSAQQGLLYEYNIGTSDPDVGDSRTVTAPTKPTWLAFVDNGNGTAKLSGTPGNGDLGTHNVVLRVTDVDGAAVDQVFTITVSNANDAPSFTSSPVLSVNEDSFYQYNITATDPDVGDVLTLKALSKPSWLTLTDNGNGTGTLTGTPLNANVGTFSIVLNVEDQAGANVNQNFSITVNNTNDAPVFSSTPVTAALQDNQYQYNVTTTDVDAGDSRTITAIVLPSWLTLTPQGGGTALLSGTPTNANLGSNPVTLRVTDFAGAISNQSFTINVDNANDPPSFSSSPVTAGTEDQPYSYSITTTDPDAGDTRVITALSIPGWLTLTDNLNGTGTLSGTPTNSHVGNFSIVLNVRDALGANSNQNFTLTISNVNDDPLFISTPVTSGVQGVQYNYSIVADDPDAGDQVTLTAPILPSWLTFTNSGNGSGSLSGTPSNGNLGANPVRLVASDMNGGSVMQEFTITVNNTNDPPTFTSTPVTAGIEDNLYTYSITATDPDVGDVLEIKSLVIPSWLTLVDHEDGTATLSGTPLNAHVGLSNVVLQVEDAQGLSVNQNFTINVSNTNDPPVFVSTPVTGAIQDQLYNHTITTSDPDQGDSRTITSLTLPSWLTLVDNNNGTASLSGTPTNANLGSNPVTIRVTDFAGAATNQSFTINVDNANDAPFFTSVAITSATEDQVYSYSITTGDPDVLDTREITSLSKPDWLTLDDNGDGTGLLSGIPTNDHVGNFTIVLNVKDALGANVNQNFTLTVANTNDPPFFTSSAIPVAVQNITYSYSVTTSDPDQGDTRTLTAPVLPAWLSFTPSGNGNGSLTGTPTNGDLGAHQVKLNIEDASGTSVEQVFTINVDNANDPPSFTSTPVTAVNEDDLYSYSISTTDPDVGDVKFITALSKPAWLTLVDNGDGTAVLSGTPLNADVGVSNVVLNVEDGIGANVNQNFSITVTNTNDAPAFTSVPVTGSIQDVQYSYSIFASDPDVGDVIVITATTKPAWLTLTDNGNGMATLQGTPTNANLGANGVTLRVTDVSGASVTQVFTINVDNQNDPPSFTSTPITSVDEDELYVYNITTTDPDVGDTRTVEALSIPGWLILTDNGDGSAVLQGTPRNGDVGVVSIVISVSDALGVDVNQNFNITVRNVNDAPGFTSVGVSVAQQGLLYEYNVVTSDPDAGDTRVITAPTLPSWLTFVDYSDGTAKLSGTPGNGNLGIHNVVLRVTDAEGAGVDQVFTINVDNANDVPSFTSSPVLSVNEDSFYQYNIVTTDPDLDDILILKALSKPVWLTLTDNGDGTGTLTGTPLNQNVGNTSIVLNVEDQAGANVNQNFTITVVNTNDAPSFTSTPILSAQQGLHYKYDILTTDPDVGDIRTIISVGSLPSWLTLSDNLEGTATLSGTPTNADLGDHTINLKVQDFGGLLDTQDFIIAVDNINDPPVFNSTPITVIDEDDLYSYSIEVTDADVGDEITLVTLIKPSWLNFTDNGDGTALLSGTPLNQNVGSHSVSIQATDIIGQSVKQDFTILVNNTNDAPTFISTPVTTTNEDETYQYSITTSDVDVGDVLTITSSVLPSWLSFSDNGDKTAVLSGIPLNEDVGELNITLTVTDGTVSVDQGFTLTVLNTNDAPVLSSTPVTTATEDEPYEYLVTYSDVDIGDQLSLVSASLPQWLSIEEIDNSSSKLKGTPANDDVGSISLTLEVVDGAGEKDTQVFTLIIENVNDKPVFESTPLLKVGIGQPYSYSVTVSDQDAGDVITLSAPLKPSFLSFTDLGGGQGLLSGTITQDITLNSEVTLRATDLSGEMVDQNFAFTINNPPILSDFIVETNEDVAYIFVLDDFQTQFTDDPGDVITSLTITSLPARGTLTYNEIPVSVGTSIDVVNNSIGNFKYTPEANFNGSDAFNWNASDGTSMANATAKVTLTILKVNDPPQLNNIEIEPVAYSLGDPGAPITESVIINDVDNNFIHSATVTITENHSVDDVLTMPAEANSNPDVTAIFDSGRGVLEISGKDTKSNYENFLRSVLFSSPVTGTATLSDKTITIVVNDSIDNSNEAIRIVQITEVFPDLDIVNSFTPNGDGVNDVWDIQNLQFYSDIRITIYDPNGTKVFECNDQSCVWDGKLGSKDLPAGAYLYTIDLNNGKRKYQGVVNILK